MSDISMLTDYTNNLLQNAKSSSGTSSISNSVKSINKDSTDDELLGACKQFEAYLWEQVYKEMDKTTNLFGTESDGSYAGNMLNIFSDDLIQEISNMSVSGEDNSLAMQLYEQLKRNMGIGVLTPEQIDAKEMAEAAAKEGLAAVEDSE